MTILSTELSVDPLVATARVEDISRAVELKIPDLRLRDVIRTRREM